jgi:hypothetical protein
VASHLNLQKWMCCANAFGALLQGLVTLRALQSILACHHVCRQEAGDAAASAAAAVQQRRRSLLASQAAAVASARAEVASQRLADQRCTLYPPIQALLNVL